MLTETANSLGHYCYKGWSSFLLHVTTGTSNFAVGLIFGVTTEVQC